MMDQFNHTYRVSVYSDKETTVVKYPITCKFNVTRGVSFYSNRATIQLYNLEAATRNQIFQDRFTFDPAQWKYVHLEVGYGDATPLIFKGRILEAYSFRPQGSTDIITQIQGTSIDIFDCQTSHTFAAGTSFKDSHNTMASDMPNVIIGNVGSLEGAFQTPTTFDGAAIEQINKLTGGHTFVDNGVLNTLMDNEVIDVPAPVISNNTNLLETPMRRDANLEIKTTFLPDIIVGQLVEVDSIISPNFNGQFKLLGFTHDCLISPTQAGSRTTQMNLWIGAMLPNSNIVVSGESQQVFSKVKDEKIQPVLQAQPSDIRGVYNHIQNHGAAPHTKLSANIWWDEVVKPNSLQYAKPTLTHLTNLYSISQYLQRFYNAYFKGSRLTIHSGWRSKAYNNTLVRAAKDSPHLYGKAIDFSINGISPNIVLQTLARWGWGGRKKAYPSDGFTHIDLLAGSGTYANDF